MVPNDMLMQLLLQRASAAPQGSAVGAMQPQVGAPMPMQPPVGTAAQGAMAQPPMMPAMGSPAGVTVGLGPQAPTIPPPAFPFGVDATKAAANKPGGTPVPVGTPGQRKPQKPPQGKMAIPQSNDQAFHM